MRFLSVFFLVQCRRSKIVIKIIPPLRDTFKIFLYIVISFDLICIFIFACWSCSVRFKKKKRKRNNMTKARCACDVHLEYGAWTGVCYPASVTSGDKICISITVNTCQKPRQKTPFTVNKFTHLLCESHASSPQQRITQAHICAFAKKGITHQRIQRTCGVTGVTSQRNHPLHKILYVTHV